MKTLLTLSRQSLYALLPCLFLCCFVLGSVISDSPAVRAQNPTYKIIQTQQDFDEVIAEARKLLMANFAIAVKWPVSGFLVPAAKLDELYSGTYRGAQVGFYHQGLGRHEIYVMQDMDKDQCLCTVAHELVHAWQSECCPPQQDILVREGFARWVEYKVLDKTGAYVLARSLSEHADPVYGVGFKRMQELEDELGEMGVVLKQRTMVKLSD